MFREKWAHVPPVPENYNVMPLSPRIAALPHFDTAYNKLAGGGGCCYISI
jgi:hypothetical protein